MKTKTVKISIRIEEDAIKAVNHLKNQVSNGQMIELGIRPENAAKKKMSISYLYDGSELKGTFVDEDLFNHILEETGNAVTSGNIYLCIGKVIGCVLSASGERVLVDVQVPISSESEDSLLIIPSSLVEPQIFTPRPGTPELQRYEIRIVGIRHHASKEAYAEMEQLSRNRGLVSLRADPENESDPLAIAVHLSSGEKVGYVASQYLPVIHLGLENCGELEASVTYMEYEGTSATAMMKIESGVSVMAVKLFSHYTPSEVYKANYVHGLWGGICDKRETGLLEKEYQSLSFGLFFSLDVNTQNSIASEWEYRMKRATVENPTNLGARMAVPLDLSVYGTSWKYLDLSDSLLLRKIELDNKVVALFFRFRRTESGGMMVSPQEFVDEVIKVKASDELMARLQEVFEKKMS